MIRKQHKRYERPRKLYDLVRIKDEDKLVERYGLKNKREIWKTEAKVRYFRNRAKLLITASEEEKQKFFSKLNDIGLNVQSIADVLALTKEDLLKRRLSSVLVSKGIVKTPKEGRQTIVHKRIRINNAVVSSPGYFVRVGEERAISMKPGQLKVKPMEKAETNE